MIRGLPTTKCPRMAPLFQQVFCLFSCSFLSTFFSHLPTYSFLFWVCDQKVRFLSKRGVILGRHGMHQRVYQGSSVTEREFELIIISKPLTQVILAVDLHLISYSNLTLPFVLLFFSFITICLLFRLLQALRVILKRIERRMTTMRAS